MLTFDLHLDLAMSAIQSNRDLTLSIEASLESAIGENEGLTIARRIPGLPLGTAATRAVRSLMASLRLESRRFTSSARSAALEVSNQRSQRIPRRLASCWRAQSVIENAP